MNDHPCPPCRHFCRPIGRRTLMGLLSLAAIAACWTAPVHAEDRPQVLDENLPLTDPTQDDATMLLGPVYKDEANGVKIAPPAGSRMIARAGLDLVSFVQDRKQWGGSVQEVILTDKTPLAKYLSDTQDDLRKTFGAVQILDTQTTTFQGRPAARLSASMQAKPDPKAAPGATAPALYRQQLLISNDDQQQEYVVLTLYALLKDKDEATRTFNAMLPTFELLNRAELLAHRKTAIAAARAWLINRTAEELKSRINNQPQLFRMRIGGQDSGYVLFSEFTTPPGSALPAFQGQSGFYLTVDSRSYPADRPDVVVVKGQNAAFWGYEKDARGADQWPQSIWANSYATDVAAPKAPGGVQTFWLREAGVVELAGSTRITAADRRKLENDRAQLIAQKAAEIPPPIPELRSHILVTWEGDQTQPFETKNRGLNTVLPDGTAPVLPKVLEYTWTRVVDLTKPCEMSFSVYNSTAAKLALRTLSVVGPQRILINNVPTDTIKCTDEMDPGSTTLWVDKTGKILVMRTSDQTVLSPTTNAEMEQVWRGRLK